GSRSGARFPRLGQITSAESRILDGLAKAGVRHSDRLEGGPHSRVRPCPRLGRLQDLCHRRDVVGAMLRQEEEALVSEDGLENRNFGYLPHVTVPAKLLSGEVACETFHTIDCCCICACA